MLAANAERPTSPPTPISSRTMAAPTEHKLAPLDLFKELAQLPTFTSATFLGPADPQGRPSPGGNRTCASPFLDVELPRLPILWLPLTRRVAPPTPSPSCRLERQTAPSRHQGVPHARRAAARDGRRLAAPTGEALAFPSLRERLPRVSSPRPVLKEPLTAEAFSFQGSAAAPGARQGQHGILLAGRPVQGHARHARR